MRFTKTLLLALSAIAVRSAVVPESNTQNTQATQNTNTQNTNNQNVNTQNTNTQNTNTQNTNTQSNSNQLTPEAQCVISSNCNQDVACIARCYGVPAPTNDMVFQTNDCALKCPDPALDNAGYLKCYNECVDNFYMGNNLGAAPVANTGAQNGNAQNGQNGNAQNGNLQNGNTQNGKLNNGNLNNNGNLSGNLNNSNSTNANGNIKLNNGNNGNLLQESGANTMTMSVLAVATAVLAFLL